MSDNFCTGNHRFQTALLKSYSLDKLYDVRIYNIYIIFSGQNKDITYLAN